MTKSIFTKQEKRIIVALLAVFILALLGLTPSLLKSCANCRQSCKEDQEYKDAIDTSNFVDITKKNNIDLCQWAIMAYKTIGAMSTGLGATNSAKQLLKTALPSTPQ